MTSKGEKQAVQEEDDQHPDCSQGCPFCQAPPAYLRCGRPCMGLARGRRRNRLIFVIVVKHLQQVSKAIFQCSLCTWTDLDSLFIREKPRS